MPGLVTEEAAAVWTAYNATKVNGYEVRLYTVAPDGDERASAGTEVPEEDGISFPTMPNDEVTIDGRTLSNTNALAFGTPTADPGDIVAAALHDPISGDRLTWDYLLNQPIAVNVGQPIIIPAGAFQARLLATA